MTLLLSLALQSCDPKIPDECKAGGHDRFEIVNNSNKRLNLEIYWNYPDTVIGTYNPLGNGGSFLKPGATWTEGRTRANCWESILNELPQQKEWYYIFDRDSLQAIPWEVVRATGRGLLERRQLDIEYLRKNNFKISYP